VLIPGRTWGLIIAVGLLIGISASHSKTFLSADTMFVISRLVAQFVLVAIAQAVCLVVGGMNLSVGAIGSLTTVALGVCLNQWLIPAGVSEGHAITIAVTFALAVGGICGLINGLLIVLVKINPFIVTLSTMFIFQGLRSGISGGMPYAVPASFTVIGQGSIYGVPYFFLIMLVVLVAVAYMYRNTVFGRRMLATGGNEDAARLSGIRTDRMILGANVLSGFLAGLVAVLYASENGSAAPETGEAWLIISFAVAIIGGTGLTGGVISALGILMGGIIYTLIRYELLALKANTYFMNVYFGLLILLAIVIDRGREVYGQRKRQTPETAAEPAEPHSN
jgi:ribose transport system permease protein